MISRKAFAIIMLLSLLTILGTILLIHQKNRNDNAEVVNQPQSTNNPGDNNAVLDDESQQIAETVQSYSTESILYNYENLPSKFEVYYPTTGNVERCEFSGCWDVTSTLDEGVLYIDLSGQSYQSLEPSVSDWVTNFGNEGYEYDYKLVGDGVSSNNQNYAIYSVNEKTEGAYLLAIVNVGDYERGQWHLAIKYTKVEDIDLIKEILDSIVLL